MNTTTILNHNDISTLKKILEFLEGSESERYIVEVNDDTLTIKKVSRKPRNLRELFESFEGEIVEEKGEIDWGKPVGEEVW